MPTSIRQQLEHIVRAAVRGEITVAQAVESIVAPKRHIVCTVDEGAHETATLEGYFEDGVLTVTNMRIEKRQ